MAYKERPRTTWQCRWVPRRTTPRTYKARDAARIMCRVVQSGTLYAEIERQFREVCPNVPRPGTFDAAAMAMQAQQVAQENIDTLNSAYNLFLTVNLVLLALLALPALIRRSPGLFVIFRGLARVQTSVAAQVTVIGRTIAANESLYTTATIALRRAA